MKYLRGLNNTNFDFRAKKFLLVTCQWKGSHAELETAQTTWNSTSLLVVVHSVVA